MLLTKIHPGKFPFLTQSSSSISLQNNQSKKKKSKNLPVFFPISDVLFASNFILSVFIIYPLMLYFLLHRALLLAAEWLQRNRQQHQQRLEGHPCRTMYLGGALSWDKKGKKEESRYGGTCMCAVHDFFPHYPAWRGIDLQDCLCQEDPGSFQAFPHAHRFCKFLCYCQAWFWRCCECLRVQIGTCLGLWKALHVWDSWRG